MRAGARSLGRRPDRRAASRARASSGSSRARAATWPAGPRRRAERPRDRRRLPGPDRRTGRRPASSTGRSIVFYASYVGATARAPSFRPHVGCMPGGGGGRCRPPTVVQARPADDPAGRAERGRARAAARRRRAACAARRSSAPRTRSASSCGPRRAPSLVASVAGRQRVSGRRVAVAVTADVEVASVQAVVQVHAICSRVR